ncbi:MAG: hypothetical protein GF401_10230 [Chitinivibrionales bacterium]|nr:hypothetical protein [Chitinivibrionales bacterium]
MKHFTVSLVMTACMLFAAETAPIISLQTDTENSSAGDQIKILVMIKDVTNLDTYSIDIVYDPEILELKQTAVEDPFAGIRNVLSAGNGKIIPVIRKEEGTVNISATLTGTHATGTIRENAALGVLIFTVKETAQTVITLKNGELLNNKREKIDPVTMQDLVIHKGDE